MTAFAVNLLIIRRRLMRSALTQLRREQPQRKSSRIMLPGCSYFKTFQLRQILREKRSCLAMLAGMFVSLLIMVLGLNCYALCRNIQKQNAEDTKYGYMYQLKYPDDEIPENGYIAYVTGLKKEVLGYDMEIMMPLMTMMTSVSVLIFLTVMYQMMKVMLDRAARSISLMKIFGYRNREIRRLYLDGNLLLTAAGALLMIPAAKLLMDFLYPVFIANVACGVDLSWPQLLYVIVYAFILLSYYLVRAVLMKRIDMH